MLENSRDFASCILDTPLGSLSLIPSTVQISADKAGEGEPYILCDQYDNSLKSKWKIKAIQISTNDD